jgi:drug/metabolite transporter (DMT)-like permease
MFFSIPCFGLAGWFFEGGMRQAPGLAPTVAILYQGIVIGSLGMILWLWLLRRHTPGSISVFTFAVPLCGLLLSAWLFSEQLTLRLFWGLLLVVAGIWLVTRPGRPRVIAATEDSL